MFNVSETKTETNSKPDYVIIYLHNFEPGLIRVHTQG